MLIALATWLLWLALSRLTRGFAVAGGMLLATGIGASRIYLGYHWVTDVIASGLVAVAWLSLVWMVRGPVQDLARRPGRLRRPRERDRRRDRERAQHPGSQRRSSGGCGGPRRSTRPGRPAGVGTLAADPLPGADYLWASPAYGGNPVGARRDRFDLLDVSVAVLGGVGRSDRGARPLRLLPPRVATVAVLRDRLLDRRVSVVSYHLVPGVQARGEYRTDRPLLVARHAREASRLRAVVSRLLAAGPVTFAVGDSNFHGLRLPGLTSAWEGREAGPGTLGSERKIDDVFGPGPGHRPDSADHGLGPQGRAGSSRRRRLEAPGRRAGRSQVLVRRPGPPIRWSRPVKESTVRAATEPHEMPAVSDERPWGSWHVLDVGEDYQVEQIHVSPRARLSVQTHEHRSRALARRGGAGHLHGRRAHARGG